MANSATSAILNPIGNFCNYFHQANSWKAHGVPFGAMVQALEHRPMLISMICRFQKCYWERWNSSGTLESIPGDGCAVRTNVDGLFLKFPEILHIYELKFCREKLI